MSLTFSFRRSLLKGILLGILLDSAIGQETNGGTNPPSSRSIRFVCAALVPQSPETLKLAGKKGLVDVPLSVRSAGDLHTLPQDGAILLGVPSNDPDRPLQPLAQGKLPESCKSATALLIPVPKQNDGTCYRMLLIDDQSIKGGDVYLLSLLEQQSAIRLDGKDILLSRDKPQIYHPVNLEQPRNIPMAVSIERNDNGKKTWDLLTASTWRLMNTRIEICVIYWDTQYNRPALKGITLFPDRNPVAP